MTGNPFSSLDFSSFNPGDVYGGKGGFGNLFGGSSSSLGATGGGGLDPLSIGLGVANFGAGIFSGARQAKAMEKAAKKQEKATLQGLLLQQEYQKNPLAIAMANPIWQNRAADFEFTRQLGAREFELGRGQEMFQAAQSEADRRSRLAKISPESKEALRFETALAARERAAGQLAGPTGMFGQTAFSRSIFA